MDKTTREEHLVIGLGEVGQAIFKVLEDRFEHIVGMNRESPPEGKFDAIHICFPPSDKFEEYVKEYSERYLNEGGLVIIHSSVPVGTSKRLNAVHSPVRGVHPHLYEGVKTFTKYFGGARSQEAALMFQECGLQVAFVENSDETEALKLWDTTYYGWNIVFNKAMKQYCDEHGLNFDFIYRIANEDYNEGYKKLGRGEVVRPVLKYMEGEIGGHCVIPNCEILGGGIARFILEENASYAIQRIDQ